MKVVKIVKITIISLIFFFFFNNLSHSLPLSTSSRWIVDARSGRRVKLTCVNWPGHLQAMVPEGLHKKPLNHIAAFVGYMGFNCVRLTWATYMFTRANYTHLTVSQSLAEWGLQEASAGVAHNNPWILGLSLVQAQKAVVRGLEAHKIMVVLDNHVSLPKWCCGDNDGNGFFGDEYFDPREWLKGLTMVAELYKHEPTVVAMSMRNELRGPHQNESEWYHYMRMGATTIHRANPNVLIIVSGLSFDINLSFLKKMPIDLNLNLNHKLVYEAHWYAFGNPLEKWLNQTNEFCGYVTQRFVDQAGFLARGSSPVPLFLSEFGVDQRGVKERDNRYFGCVLAFLAETDMDWAFWALQGSYMLREGKVGMEETYGLLDGDWAYLRNPKARDKLQLIQRMTQDPRSKRPKDYLMYHPQSGQCAHIGWYGIYLSDCRSATRWSHDGDKSPIRLSHWPSWCLSIAGDGRPAILSRDCSSDRSRWEPVSGSKLHMAAKDENQRYLCLGLGSSKYPIILSKKCLCLGDDLKDDPMCDENPQTQWFKLVPTNTI